MASDQDAKTWRRPEAEREAQACSSELTIPLSSRKGTDIAMETREVS